MSLPRPPTEPSSGRTHLLQVWLVGLILVLATHFVHDAQNLRPGRVLGALGIEGLWSPFPSLDSAESPDPAAPVPNQAASTTPRDRQTSAPSEAKDDRRSPAEANSHGQGSRDDTGGFKGPTSTVANADAGTVAGSVPGTSGGAPTVADSSEPRSPPPAVPERTGVARPIEGGQHLAGFFRSLDRSSSELTRVLHYGDSTLAGDGIAKTVRSRLKQRFGDGGAGFFVAGMDPRWMRRDDLRIGREGDWDIHTILFGGNNGRYGLGGVSARPRGMGAVHASASRKGATMGRRIEVYSNLARSGTPLKLQVNGQPTEGLTRNTLERFERWTIDLDEDVSALKLSVLEPGLEIYGIVSEFSQGITWETTAVVGIASGSMRQFNAEHLAAQSAARAPHLVILMLGGNETGHGGLASPDGRLYREGYLNALNTIRRGAPQAACLVMAPLDQAFQGEDGKARSKPVMGKMVQVQREAAHQAGCAFWDSWSFMGGNGGFGRWLSQGMAWTDLVHLTEKGLTRVGDALTEALLAEYEHWRGEASATRTGSSR